MKILKMVRKYRQWCTSQDENFENGYFNYNALLKRQWNCPMLRLCPAAVRCIKPLASCIISLVNQWKVMSRNDVEFATVYHRIYSQKILRRYPIRRSISFASALECGISWLYLCFCWIKSVLVSLLLDAIGLIWDCVISLPNSLVFCVCDHLSHAMRWLMQVF